MNSIMEQKGIAAMLMRDFLAKNFEHAIGILGAHDEPGTRAMLEDILKSVPLFLRNFVEEGPPESALLRKAAADEAITGLTQVIAGAFKRLNAGEGAA